MAQIRLDKYLADAGIGTRSQVKQYIKKGMVSVNGTTISSADMKINEDSDIVKYNGRQLCYSKYRYFLLNKPAGYVSATKDNVHKTVIDILKNENTKDLFPVGRLDIDTEGLDIKVTKTELDETSGTVNALLANIPIKEGSRNFRK